MPANDQQPVQPPAAGKLPPFSWSALWDALKPHSSSLARAWKEECGGIGWAAALRVTGEAAALPNLSVPEQRRRLGAMADSPGKLCCLVATGSRVHVLFGWRACRPLDGDGKVWAGFLGDRRVSPGGAVMEPRLYCAPGGPNDQYKAFARTAVAAPTLAFIQQAHAGNANLGLLELADDAETEQVNVWSAWACQRRR